MLRDKRGLGTSRIYPAQLVARKFISERWGNELSFTLSAKCTSTVANVTVRGASIYCRWLWFPPRVHQRNAKQHPERASEGKVQKRVGPFRWKEGGHTKPI